MKDFATEGLNILAYFSQFSAAFSSKSRSGLTTVKHWHVETGRNAKTPHWRVWHYYLSQVIRLRDAMKSEVVQQASRDRAFLLNFLTYFMWQEQHWRLKFGIAHPLFCPPRLSKKRCCCIGCYHSSRMPLLHSKRCAIQGKMKLASKNIRETSTVLRITSDPCSLKPSFFQKFPLMLARSMPGAKIEYSI